MYPSFKANRRDALDKHNTIHKNQIRKEKKRDTFCNRCDFKTKFRNALIKHMKKHNSKCNQCDFKAGSTVSLQEHMELQHKEISYNCNQCTFETAHEKKLSVHMKVEHQGMGYTCGYCSYSSVWKNALKNHIVRKHEEGITVSCEKCGFTAKTKISMDKHIKSNHSENEYKFKPNLELNSKNFLKLKEDSGSLQASIKEYQSKDKEQIKIKSVFKHGILDPTVTQEIKNIPNNEVKKENDVNREFCL